MENTRNRNWCFTLNNYTDEEKKELKTTKCRYIILGYEKGECGTPHIQGFIQFEQPQRLTALKKINKRAHWEIMKGTVEQAVNYCKKDEIFEEKGTYTITGQRNDLKEAKEKIKIGGMRAITGYDDNYNNQVIRSCEITLKYHEKARDFKPEVIWIYGNTGSGKSKLAHEKACNNTYEKDSTKWWDGYDAHNTVIMDDFRASNMRLNELLKLLDRYGHRVEQKGTFRQMLAKKMIITSIEHPKDIYQKWHKVGNEPIEQLLRRIDKIIHVHSEKDIKSGIEKPQKT